MRLMLAALLLALTLPAARAGEIPLDDFEDGDRLHAFHMGWVAAGPASNVLETPFDANPVAAPGGGWRLEVRARLGVPAKDAGHAHAGVTCGLPESFGREHGASTCGLAFTLSGSPGVRHVLQVHVREVTDGAHFEVALAPGAEPARMHVRWPDLKQPAWGRSVGALKPESITGLLWLAEGRAGVDACLTLDDVAFTTPVAGACRASDGLAAPGSAAALTAPGGPDLLRRNVRFAGSATTLPEGGTRVPADVTWGGGPLVDATIDGQGPFRMVFDTGAEISMLTTATAERLGVTPRGSTTLSAFHAKSVVRAPIASVRELKVGEWSTRDVDVLLMQFVGPPAARVDGVIGFGLVRDLLVTLDGPAGELRLERGRLPKGSPKLVRDTDDILPHVVVDLGGEARSCLLDSGSSGLLDVPKDVASRLVRDWTAVGWASGADGVVRRDLEGRLAGDVRVGEALLRTPLLSSDARTCTVGSQFLRHVVTTWDMPSRRVRIVRPGGEPIVMPPELGRGFYTEWRCGRNVVADVLPGSPADAAGLRAGAWVAAVDGRSVTDLSEDEMRALFARDGAVRLALEGVPGDVSVEKGVLLR